jgi:hypothetical protein
LNPVSGFRAACSNPGQFSRKMSKFSDFIQECDELRLEGRHQSLRQYIGNMFVIVRQQINSALQRTIRLNCQLKQADGGGPTLGFFDDCIQNGRVYFG